MFAGRGPLSVFPMNAMAFLRSDPALERPDIQYYLVPNAMNPNGSATYLPTFHGYNIHWCGLRPESRGSVTLKSSNPFDAPRIAHNYLSTEGDQALNRYAFRLARELHAQPAFDEFRGEEVDPGPACTSDADIDGFMSKFISSHYHPVGTCKMGQEDKAVVDAKLKVHGLTDSRGRCLDHADACGGEHKRAHDHDRREGGRHCVERLRKGSRAEVQLWVIILLTLSLENKRTLVYVS